MKLAPASTILAVMQAVAAPALAACPMELAVYGETDAGSTLEFRPGETGIVSNAFRLVLGNDVVLDGIVMWSDGPGRPFGTLMHGCPEGDVTGDEIAACTAWEGVVYTSDELGNISTLPPEGADAPPTLILTDLARGIRFSTAFSAIGIEGIPWDVFTLSGCQE